MNNDALAFNANELIAFLQKPKEEFTKADIGSKGMDVTDRFVLDIMTHKSNTKNS